MSRWWSEHAYHMTSYDIYRLVPEYRSQQQSLHVPINLVACATHCYWNPERGGNSQSPMSPAFKEYKKLKQHQHWKVNHQHDKMCVWCISGFLWNNFLAKKKPYTKWNRCDWSVGVSISQSMLENTNPFPKFQVESENRKRGPSRSKLWECRFPQKNYPWNPWT